MFFDSEKSQLKVIFGPMYSGKSGELVKTCLQEKKYHYKKVLLFKPTYDDRFSKTKVVSRIGLSENAVNIPRDLSNHLKILKETDTIEGLNINDYDIIGFDEIQFHSKEIVDIIKYILNKNVSVVCASLNYSYQNKPIGYVGELALIADDIIPLKAYCKICGEPAMFTKKIAKNEDDRIDIIGDEETYIPCCRKHFYEE